VLTGITEMGGVGKLGVVAADGRLSSLPFEKNVPWARGYFGTVCAHREYSTIDGRASSGFAHSRGVP